jgi:hypothetical protein
MQRVSSYFYNAKGDRGRHSDSDRFSYTRPQWRHFFAIREHGAPHSIITTPRLDTLRMSDKQWNNNNQTLTKFKRKS